MDKIFCVISHTHWDREWYHQHEIMRFRLTDLIDNLLGILEDYPEFIFHLDAQTVVLDDYVEIRPDKKELLKKHISAGSILVGPWYVQNDFFLTDGESTVRNVIIGSRIAEEYGKCTKVGYVPDQFGLISQLPQIFDKFGIDNCIFGRGYTPYEKGDGHFRPKRINSEFEWSSPDGSKVLAILMPFWYNNAQRISADPVKAMKMFEVTERVFNGVALTPYLLMMNGVDHLEAQEDLLPIIEDCNKRYNGTDKIIQTKMDEYIGMVRDYVAKKSIKLDEVNGELRMGHDYSILAGTFSSRPYLKSTNAYLQNLLSGSLEPVHTMGLAATGNKKIYPDQHIDFFWKSLIKNHAHDSICGCSVDAVHARMEDRFEVIKQSGEYILGRGLETLSHRVDKNDMYDRDYIITVVNTTQDKRSGVVRTTVECPVAEGVNSFTLTDEKGNPARFEVLSHTKGFKSIISAINLPGVMDVDCFDVELFVDGIEGGAVRYYKLRPLSEEAVISAGCSCFELENDRLGVYVGGDGSIDLTDKVNGNVYENVLYFEDGGDCGDAYVYRKPAKDTVITTKGLNPSVSVTHTTPLTKTVRLEYNIALPAKTMEYWSGNARRSEAYVNNNLKVYLTLSEGDRFLSVKTVYDNKSCDHRFRAVIRTDIDNDISTSLTPYDVVERDRRDILRGINGNGCQPNSGMFNIDNKDTTRGVTVLNKGMYEYEHLLGDGGELALTIVRSTGVINHDAGRQDKEKLWTCPENQCLREVVQEFAIYPHAGCIVRSGAVKAAMEFQNPLLVHFTAADAKKFVGGRTAVQDAALEELFYRADPYEGSLIDSNVPFVKLTGDGIVRTALKKAEKSEDIVLRAFSCSTKDREAVLSFAKAPKAVWIADLYENAKTEISPEGGVYKVAFKPKEIQTVLIKM
ncbi:MAG: alpha-mannosidase [Eubacteriales bacterium]